MSTRRRLLVAGVALVAMIVPLAASAAPPAGAAGRIRNCSQRSPGGAGSGSAIGPGGALYVPQPATGEIWRIDPRAETKTLYASGLPQRFAGLPFGGVMDVAFYGSTAYALVSVVGPSFPADLVACDPDLIGIYRINGPSSSTLVADIGTFACDNPPPTVPIRRADRSAVRARTVPRRIPRHRRTSQPRVSRHAGRNGHADDPVRRHRPDRARGPRKHDLSWRKPARFRTSRRTGRSSRSSPDRRRHRRRVRRSPRRGRRDRPRADAVRPLAGHSSPATDPTARASPADPDTGRSCGRTRTAP